MSNYTKTTNFASKDNLSPGNPLKIVKGTEIDTEFNNIATAVATKTDNASANITGGSITGITDLAVADGGTGASTATAALNNLLPSQTGNANKYLQTDGTNASWDAVSLSTSDITGTLPVANGGTGVTTSTGTGAVVLSNSPTLVTPALGTPSSGTATNLTGLPISTGVSGLGTGVAEFLGTPSSANLASAVTDETGSGALVFANSPTLVTPALGTPASATLTNATGLPISTGVSGLGTGVASFLATPSSANLATAVSDETGSGALVFANSPTLVTPALGTPSSATLTNATGLPIATGVSGLGTGVATALAVNVGSSGAPVVNGGVLGTPSSGTATNLTGLPLTTGVTGTLPVANGGTGVTTSTGTGNVVLSASPTLTGDVTLNAQGDLRFADADSSNWVAFQAPTTIASNVTWTLPNADGTSNQVLSTNGTGTLSWTTASSSQWTTSGSNIYYTTGSVLVGGTSAISSEKFQTLNTSNGAVSLAMRLINGGTSTGTGSRIAFSGYINGSSGFDDIALIDGVSTGASAGALVFRTNNAGSFDERARFNSTGAFVLAGGTTTANGIGITFPATQSASSNANTLDDYEEGTFTPTVAGGTTTTGSVTATGTYTKVGRIVSVSGYIGATTVSYNPAGGNFITGLPFTPISNTIGVAMMQNGNNSGSSVASVQAGSAILGFASIASGAGTIFYSGTFMTS